MHSCILFMQLHAMGQNLVPLLQDKTSITDGSSPPKFPCVGESLGGTELLQWPLCHLPSQTLAQEMFLRPHDSFGAIVDEHKLGQPEDCSNVCQGVAHV